MARPDGAPGIAVVVLGLLGLPSGAGGPGLRRRAVRDLDQRRSGAVRERLLLAHVEEHAARDAAAEHLIGHSDRRPRLVGALGPQHRREDVALRALGAVDDRDLERAVLQAAERAKG